MRILWIVAAIGALLALGCQRQEAAAPDSAARKTAPRKHASNTPPLHPTNIVSLASASKDHTTLVAAIEAADYVTSVAASGPLTVFAPTNEAFDELPPGTVDGLLEPKNADQLRKILQYHVTTSALPVASFTDGQRLAMANGAKTTIRVKDGQISINDANVTSSVPASNGMLHIIDGVLLPPAK